MNDVLATLCYMGTRPKLDMVRIGRRAADRRDELGLEQEDVATKACMSRGYISRLENGIVKNPKIEDLAAVANALGYSIDRLIYGQPDAELIADLPKVIARVSDPEVGGAIADVLGRWDELGPGKRIFFVELVRNI